MMLPGRPMVRVLGAVDVSIASVPVAVGGPRRQALLAALAIGAGHAVPIDHLVSVVWNDDPPPTAASTLQTKVSRLRQVLGHGTIVRVDHSYELSTDLVDIDARRFEELLHRAEQARPDPATCVELCRQALGLWRGRPFGDLADADGFVLEALRLDELRANASELTIEAELALGRAETVVAELTAAVKEQPYRERLWRLLIEALARSDRRVEALRACAELRAVLGDVGLMPGPWLIELEHAIAAGEPLDEISRRLPDRTTAQTRAKSDTWVSSAPASA